MTEQSHHRRIRSFALRQGRMTASQQRALDTLWDKYVITLPSGELELDAVFGRRAPRILEIGFGMGQSLLEMARQHPDTDYLGIEVHRPGVGSLMLNLEQHAVSNVRVIYDDAVEVLQGHLPDNSLDAVYLFFPDPWPKTKHRKRRIVQPAFIELLARRLKPGGILHMATDWEDYAKHMLAMMSMSAEFENCAGPGRYSARPDYRPQTKFERRGHNLGHAVWDLIFCKT
jgi:tRNA (guanine-N7-)-methyltransferase